MVQSYMRANNRIEAVENQFKDGRPGRTWLKSFMKRNKLSLKKASMICIARKSNTSNPFIIYDFFDKLEEILQENLEITVEKIWNFDESGFPTDPAKCKVIFNPQ